MMRQYLMLFALLPMLCHAQTASRNYVKTVIMLDENGCTTLPSVQYYDGLGYPTVAVSTVGINGQTAATLTTYDAVGRECRNYVPVPGNGLEHMTESNFSSKAYYYMDSSGYTQNHYDALGRVTAVDIAGDKWKSAGKQNSTEYLANTSDDKVFHYEAPVGDSNSLTSPESTSYTYYPAGTLTKVVSRDAERKSVTVFTDFFGNKILERTAAGDTYYVYNNLGQLRFVLSPEYKNNSANKAIYSYEYRYNNKGRLIEKILPGGDGDGVSVKYWYDNADRVAFAQDAALGGRYRFCLYDKFGRMCVQGTCSSVNTSTDKLSTTTFSAGSDGICKTGYSIPYTISSPQLEIVNYYDKYDFKDKQKNVMPAVTITEEQKQYSIGFLTGSVVYTSNGQALGSVSVYDQKGQVVRSLRKGLDNFVEDVSTVYTFTGAVANAEAKVNVKYGSSFIAKTCYEYAYGKKKNMSLSVSHGNSALTRTTAYNYDFTGKLSRKDRQLGSQKSYCSYTYDIHGWLTSISSGGFTEQLYYADGLNGGYYNGNISTIKWKTAGDISCQGYNLEYDENNRLQCATFGTGDNLTGSSGYFNESAEYDGNGNITKLKRGGLVNKMYGGFGLVDNLTMTYDGNRLMSVRDDASRHTYTGATDFDGVKGHEYPLTYNDAGALVSDEGRKIARIDYDAFSNPIRIQFTNGNVTKYIYSATGEKLRVVYQTAVPNISVPIGETRELSTTEILSTDCTDYLLGGNLTMNNGRIDKYYFEEGYCQAEANYQNDYFTFCYFDQDHLGNVRQVTQADGTTKGTVIQKMNYYPFGAELCDGSANTSTQKRKYNGKEFDNMHGLNTYDYGARQYNPVTARWDRMDPLAEKYSGVSPYAYCLNNPVRFIDPDGERPKASEAALMAAYVYMDDNKNNYLNKLKDCGWELSKFPTSIQMNYTDFNQNGLQSALFQHTDKNGTTEYAYVFAGTNSAEDVVEDLAQLAGAAPQYHTAIDNARTLSKELGSNELTFVGHSLGGGEAIASSMATGRAAITFNPAAVSGLTKQIEGLNKKPDVVNYRAVGTKIGIGNIRIGGDMLNNLQEKVGLSLPGKTIGIPTGIIPTHTIDDFLNHKLPEP